MDPSECSGIDREANFLAVINSRLSFDEHAVKLTMALVWAHHLPAGL